MFSLLFANDADEGAIFLFRSVKRNVIHNVNPSHNAQCSSHHSLHFKSSPPS